MCKVGRVALDVQRRQIQSAVHCSPVFGEDVLEDAERHGRTHEFALSPLPDPLDLPQLAALALHVSSVEVQLDVDVGLQFYLIRHTEQKVDAGAVEGEASEPLLTAAGA